MIYISHRGNTNYINEMYENHPSYIQEALDLGYQCEVDVWYRNGHFYLGHNEPEFLIPVDWLLKRKWSLWVHCKNIEALEEMSRYYLNYFWHESDDYTVTSRNWVWAYPDRITSTKYNRTIAVLPEIKDTDVSEFAGICSDFISNYRSQQYVLYRYIRSTEQRYTRCCP